MGYYDDASYECCVDEVRSSRFMVNPRLLSISHIVYIYHRGGWGGGGWRRGVYFQVYKAYFLQYIIIMDITDIASYLSWPRVRVFLVAISARWKYVIFVSTCSYLHIRE